MLGAAGCTAGARAGVPASGATPAPSSLVEVSADGVSVLIPHGWVAALTAGPKNTLGLTASPGPLTSDTFLPRQGLIATRIDATQVGVPSDLYYLAAKGPLIAGLTHASGCEVTRRRIYADHRPAWLAGDRRSPGDFVASASGSCTRHGGTTRWSYFVAAPGFGPARERGIPGSGLYLIVAATPQAPGANQALDRMIDDVRFGADGARDFVQAVRAA